MSEELTTLGVWLVSFSGYVLYEQCDKTVPHRIVPALGVQQALSSYIIMVIFIEMVGDGMLY